MKRTLLLAVAAIAIGSPALAADPILGGRASFFEPNSSADFTGLYFGGQLGGAFADGSGDVAFTQNSFSDDLFGSSSNLDDTRFIGGVHIGYDVEVGGLVVGAVADINYLDTNLARRFDVGSDSFAVEQDVNFTATARLRAGKAFDRFLVYGTGGVAYVDADTDFVVPTTFTTTNGFTTTASSSRDDFGYVVGGGVDFLASQSLSFGVEYLYTDIGSNDFDVTFANVTTGETFTGSSQQDFDFHTVWAKASYRFN